MAIEGIGAGRVEPYIAAAPSNTTVSSQKQSTEASARIMEVEPVERDRKPKSGEASLKKAGDGRGAESIAMDNETLKKKISDINRQLLNTTECQYGIHEETQRVTLKIVDKETKEVIKELPPEKTLEMIAKVWEIAGLLVDEKR